MEHEIIEDIMSIKIHKSISYYNIGWIQNAITYVIELMKINSIIRVQSTNTNLILSVQIFLRTAIKDF